MTAQGFVAEEILLDIRSAGRLDFVIAACRVGFPHRLLYFLVVPLRPCLRPFGCLADGRCFIMPVLDALRPPRIDPLNVQEVAKLCVTNRAGCAVSHLACLDEAAEVSRLLVILGGNAGGLVQDNSEIF